MAAVCVGAAALIVATGGGTAAVSATGAVTGAIGAKFPHMNKLLAGLIDTAVSTAERGALYALEEDVTFIEGVAYTLDLRTIAFDFLSGVVIDYAVDGISDFFRGRNAVQLADGMTDQVSDAVEDSVMRETLEDALGDNVNREAREAVEDVAGDTAGEVMDDLVEGAQYLK